MSVQTAVSALLGFAFFGSSSRPAFTGSTEYCDACFFKRADRSEPRLMKVEVEIPDEAYAVLKAFSPAARKEVDEIVRWSVSRGVHAILLATTPEEINEAVEDKLK